MKILTSNQTNYDQEVKELIEDITNDDMFRYPVISVVGHEYYKLNE